VGLLRGYDLWQTREVEAEMFTPAGEAPSDASGTHRSVLQGARLVLGLIILVAAVAIVVDNRQTTRVGYVFGDVRAPLVVVLLLSAAAGALIGWLLSHRPSHQED
jgi:uncharacterized integral membrane protein